jgi:hypothetical protein
MMSATLEAVTSYLDVPIHRHAADPTGFSSSVVR